LKRVTGIGGIFFKAKDPAVPACLYKRHLGIDVRNGVVPLSVGPDDKKALPSQEQQSGRRSAEGDNFAPEFQLRSPW